MERLVNPMRERLDPYVVSWLKWKKTFVQLKEYMKSITNSIDHNSERKKKSGGLPHSEGYKTTK